MMTSPTSSPRTATRSVLSAEQVIKLAFRDELEKISAAKQPSAKNAALRKWVNTTLAIAAGTAAGTGALMLGERAASSLLTKSWNKLSPQTRLIILGAGSSAAALGATHLAKKMLDRKRKEEA
jgi:hypothetical protein